MDEFLHPTKPLFIFWQIKSILSTHPAFHSQQQLQIRGTQISLSGLDTMQTMAVVCEKFVLSLVSSIPDRFLREH